MTVELTFRRRSFVDLRMMEGFLGTGASMLADLTLLAYVLLIVPGMIAGFVFARRRMFEPQHKYTMTGIVIFNWVLILWLMVFSYRDGVAPGVPDALGDVRVWLPTVHLGIGALAQLMATYLVLRMWFENVLPPALMVKNIKLYMRMTLAGWLIAALLGIGIYATWYVVPTVAGGEVPPPASTEEVAPPETTEEAAAQPEATDEPAAVESTEEAVSEPEVTEEAEAQSDATDEPVVEETTEEAVAPPETTEEAIAEPEVTEEAG
jgi:uncharacterized membrane protein YozB (DUF420 family)